MHKRRREKKDRLDKENKQVRSMSREGKIQNNKVGGQNCNKRSKVGREGLWSHAVISHKRETVQQLSLELFYAELCRFTLKKLALKLYISGGDHVLFLTG